ncbi:MAG: 4-(cytidine 5'-diphospho)-2-C-methyl-D-erythritol kinase [Endomicrobiia bacterium]|nr:4-(cytidine 5'-diphospho)-2-C-methyl-D-erythritol kinase [Endomicrobiia bacterium]
MNEIILRAPAKINLFLEIERRRPDGYHDISSVFRLIDVADEIAAERIPSGVEFSCDVPSLDGPDNLAARAARAALGAARIRGGVKIKLSKKIPWGSGLGGASSDAAAAINASLALYGVEMDKARLIKIGKYLGADVPFFLSGAATAEVRGIGEQIVPLEWPRNLDIVVVKPPFSISTKEAYSRLAFPLTAPRQIDKITAAIKAGEPIEKIAPHLFNRFEEIAAQSHPEIRNLKGFLDDQGALASLMSGSGSAVFGIFADKISASLASAAVQRESLRAYATRTL